ncbi:unnamed protein product [Acanthosepion pharaonis]|uniref:Uncharacterized protein n=1 Tax=Acanthosepion pharaonis TaxID=158019 RepID=A0A812BKE3_ACAPH|nr:unnamed protein product [Sepia pharaonis]
MYVYLSITGPKYEYLLFIFSSLFFIFVLSSLFPTQTQFHTLSGCNRGIHFLPLFVLPFSFLPFSSVDSSVSKPDSLQQGYPLSSSLWFSSFFPSSLHNSVYNRGIHFPLWFSFFFLYTIQLVTEVYTFFLSGSPFSFLYTIQLVTEVYTFHLWFSFLFTRRLNPQRINFSASSISNRNTSYISCPELPGLNWMGSITIK